MQREVLEAEPAAKLRVYAVWVPFLGGTSQAADVSRRVLPDPRVTQFWDGDAVTSEWFAKNVDHSPAPAWDVYYLLGPDASWIDVPGPMVSSGGSIIGQSSALRNAIATLLSNSSVA